MKLYFAKAHTKRGYVEIRPVDIFTNLFMSHCFRASTLQDTDVKNERNKQNGNQEAPQS